MKDIFTNIEQQIESIDAKIEGIMNNVTDKGQYDTLNQKINDMVNASASAFERGYSRAESVVKKQSEKIKSSYDLQQEKIKNVKANYEEQEKQKKQTAKMKNLFAKKDGYYGGGIAMSISGFVFSTIFALGVASMWFMNAITFRTTGFWNAINRIFLIPGFTIFIIIAIIGTLMAGKVSRYRKYIKALNGQLSIPMNELALLVGKSENYLQRDLMNLSRKNWFREGRITPDKLMFFVEFNAYKEYMEEAIAKEEIKQSYKQQAVIREQLPEDAKLIVRLGEDYLKAIHEKKVEISDYDMTIKLTHLENVLKKIFGRVSTNPETVSAVRKSVDYYLPTTVKLLDAYVQLDKQSIAGENIIAAKVEINNSLDTLTTAYEKLLDDLFADVMLDVSTDISVLNTMLAQDGLTSGNDFKNE